MSALFPSLAPLRLPETIDLRCGDVRDLVREVRGATLVVADPPWQYETNPACKNHDDLSAGGVPRYETMGMVEIAKIVDATFDCAAKNARLLLWCTFPQLGDWFAQPSPRWRYVSGGAWGKVAGEFGSGGIGFHWAGRAEIVLLYVKGSPPKTPGYYLANHHVSPTTFHSRKPVEWQQSWLRAWTKEGDVVLDPWAGTASVASACKLEGRRYVGAEIDPERHGRACAFVARAE